MKLKQSVAPRQRPQRGRSLGTAVYTTLLGLASLFVIAGCGDTFRPIANPLPKPSPDPKGSGTAVVVFSGGAVPAGGTAAPGTSLQINVSGDTITGQVPLGVNPIYALISGSIVSVNQGDGSLSSYATSAGNFQLISGVPLPPPTVTTVSLPPDAAPKFAVTAAGNTYVAFSQTGQVGVVNSSDAFVGSLTVGANPTALVALPNGSKVYAINQGSNNVSVINTSDNSVSGPIAVGTTPVYGVASADSRLLFVVNQGSGNVTVIDTANDTVVAPLPVGSAPNYAIFDANLGRVYVTNRGSNSLTIINIPNLNATDVHDPNFFGPSVNVAVGTAPSSVAALPDKTKVYVANFGSNTVSVIDALSNLVVKTISVGVHPISIAASPDSTKVVVANQGDQASATAGSVSMISTATDAETSRINAPASTCPTSAPCAPQTAVIAGVL